MNASLRLTAASDKPHYVASFSSIPLAAGVSRGVVAAEPGRPNLEDDRDDDEGAACTT